MTGDKTRRETKMRGSEEVSIVLCTYKTIETQQLNAEVRGWCINVQYTFSFLGDGLTDIDVNLLPVLYC